VTIRIETGQLTLGTRVIPYTLRRSTRRRKTIEISVDPSDGLLVAAPWTASEAEIARVVEQRAAWVLRRLEAHRNGHRIDAKREWITGETVVYLGRNYRLRIVEGGAGDEAPIRLTGRWLEVRTNGKGDRRIATVVEGWYRRAAAECLTERVAVYAPKIFVRPKKIVIRSQTKRWASCGPDGVLRFNWRIVMAPLSLVDYVVVHELCHLRHRRHDGRFWGCVAAVLPDYETRREALRREGPAYTLG
jgi:predicted metal-dependent hydrolase